jgi:hypothetical protein
MDVEVTKAIVEAVMNSLGTARFKWRTVPGVAKETGLAEEVVRRAIAQSAEQIVRSAVSSADGQELFTTRERFRQTASLSEKLLGAIKNRAV